MTDHRGIVAQHNTGQADPAACFATREKTLSPGSDDNDRSSFVRSLRYEHEVIFVKPALGVVL